MRAPRARAPKTELRRGIAAALMLWLVAGAAAQIPATALNPVYPDDSPVARETLARVSEFIAAGNQSQALRELQRLLEEQGDRVVQRPGNADLYISVRQHVHERLLSSAELLAAYRAAEDAQAARDLAAGDVALVERVRLLTRAGLDAAVRVAQRQLESAQFEGARLTLEQLESHPDRRAAGPEAAQTLMLVARYLDRPAVWERAERWTSESGAEAQPRPPAFPRPRILREPRTSWDSPVPRPGDRIPFAPLWSGRIEPAPLPEGARDGQPEIDAPPEQIPENQWVFPTLAGDLVLINDGTFLTARDRYTLQPRWSIHVVGDGSAEDPFIVRRQAGQNSRGRGVEDASTVSVYGPTAVATMGLAESGTRTGVPDTVAVDLRTGQVVWSRDVSTLDPQLDAASVRGRALIDPLGGGTLVLGLRKPALGRRTVTFYLVGLDLEQGTLRWLRPVASAGSIPWTRSDRRIGWSPVLHEGVVYAVDPLGVMTAVEADSGRTLWVRTCPVDAMGNMGGPDPTAPWQWSEPIVDGPSLLTLSPDKRELWRVDRATGVIAARLDCASLAMPAYLVRSGGSLVGVGNEWLAFVPAADIEGGRVKQVRVVERGGSGLGIRGRVLPTEGGVIVPRPDGLALVATPGDGPVQPPTLIRLERSGTALPLGEQVVVLDPVQLHNFITWETVDQLLTQRIRENPADPEPAVSAAQMAFQAGRVERVAPAADQAIEAIERDPRLPHNVRERQRLFEVLASIVTTTQARWASDKPAESPMIDVSGMDVIVQRLGRTASSTAERIVHQFALGRHQEAAERPGLALEAYQRVLAEPALASGTWTSGGIGIRADLEATRRIRELVSQRGPASYEPFDAEANQRLSQLGENAQPEQLERLAREFPASAAASIVWTRLAELHDASGKPRAAIAALREALTIAEVAPDREQSPGLGEIAGRLVSALQRRDQPFTAAQVLTRVRAQHPSAAITLRGQTIDDQTLLSELQQRLASLERLPRIGAAVRGDPQPIAGWVLMTPRSRSRSAAATEQVVMVQPRQDTLALWGVRGVAGAFEPLWTRVYTKGQPPVLLASGPQHVDLLWPRWPEHAPREGAGDGPVIERIGTLDGATRWFTPPLTNVLSTMPRTIDVAPAADPRTPAREGLLVALDEGVMVLAERRGRVVAYDTATGKVLWTKDTQWATITDVAAGGEVVVLAGQSAPRPGVASKPGALVLDARTGQPMHRFDDLPDVVRWIRIAPEPAKSAAGPVVVLGLTSSLMGIDSASGRVNWTISGVPAANSMEGWIAGDRLIILDAARALWSAELATGQLGAKPLDAQRRIESSVQIDGIPLAGGRFALASERGLCVFDRSGALIALDGLSGPGEPASMIPPVPASEFFVAVESSPRDGETGYRLHLIDAQTGLLRSTRLLSGLELPPSRVGLLDGRILVTAGPNTVVYPAPEAP